MVSPLIRLSLFSNSLTNKLSSDSPSNHPVWRKSIQIKLPNWREMWRRETTAYQTKYRKEINQEKPETGPPAGPRPDADTFRGTEFLERYRSLVAHKEQPAPPRRQSSTKSSVIRPGGPERLRSDPTPQPGYLVCIWSVWNSGGIFHVYERHLFSTNIFNVLRFDYINLKGILKIIYSNIV